MKRDALQRLIAPLSTEELIQNYWMQRSLFIRGGLDKVAGLFSLARFHAAVAAAAARPDSARQGFDVRAGAMRAIPPSTIASELAAGNTICVSSIEVGDVRLAELAAELKLQLAFPGRVAVNAYLSPRGSGFSFVHFDARIATTMQIEGRKKWRYAERSSLPWPMHNVRVAPDGTMDWHQPPTAWEQRAGLTGDVPLTDVILEPGDLLCLPPGTFHAAEAMDDVSLSININFSYGGFLDLIGGYLRARLFELPGWREPSPAVVATELDRGTLPPSVAEFVTARLDELRRALDELDPRVSADAALTWHGALHVPVPSLPPQFVDAVTPTDVLEVMRVSYLRPSATASRGYLVTGGGVVELIGEAMLPFASQLVQHRRFVAADALAWSGSATPYRWEDLQPTLSGLIARGVLARTT